MKPFLAKTGPARQNVSWRQWRATCDLQNATNGYVNWLLSSKAAALSREPDHVWDMLAVQMQNSLGNLPLRGGYSVSLEWPAWEKITDDSTGAVEKLVARLADLHDYLRTAVLLGSAATDEVIINWSDLDVWLVVGDRAFASGDDLMRLRTGLITAEKELYRFDSWQHHGFHIVSERDLVFYPETFMPLKVLQLGKFLAGASKLDFRLRDSTQEKKRRFLGVCSLLRRSADSGELAHHGRQGIYLQDDFANADKTFYQFKYFISVVLLLPSMWLELAENRAVDKKTSFERIDDYFKPSQLELVRKAEQVRLAAASLPEITETIPPLMQDILGKHYLRRGAVLAEAMMGHDRYPKS